MIFIDKSALNSVKVYNGTYKEVIQWEDEYDEDSYPVKEYPFTVTTLSGFNPKQETVMKINWIESKPIKHSLIEEQIHKEFSL